LTTYLDATPGAAVMADIGLIGADRSQPLIVEIVGMLLFCDARCDAADVAPGDDRRGWWHDTLDEAGSFGSLIWTFRGRPLTDDTLRGVEQAAENALASIVTDGLASAVSATATRGTNGLALAVTVTSPDGSTQVITWPSVWG
jgi:phage gp46-like protein